MHHCSISRKQDGQKHAVRNLDNLLQTWNTKRKKHSMVYYSLSKFNYFKRNLKLKLLGDFPKTDPENETQIVSAHLVSAQSWKDQYVVAGYSIDRHLGVLIDPDSLEIVRPVLFNFRSVTCHCLKIYKDLAIVVTHFGQLYFLPVDNAEERPFGLPSANVNQNIKGANINCNRNLRLDGQMLYVQLEDSVLIRVDLDVVDMDDFEDTVENVVKESVPFRADVFGDLNDFIIIKDKIYLATSKGLLKMNKKTLKEEKFLKGDEIYFMTGSKDVLIGANDSEFMVYRLGLRRTELMDSVPMPDSRVAKKLMEIHTFKRVHFVVCMADEGKTAGVNIMAVFRWKLQLVLFQEVVKEADTFKILGLLYDSNRSHLVFCLQHNQSAISN